MRDPTCTLAPPFRPHLSEVHNVLDARVRIGRWLTHQRILQRSDRHGGGGEASADGPAYADPVTGDLQTLQLKRDSASCTERHALLVDALSPFQHWPPAGLYATQRFCRQLL